MTSPEKDDETGATPPDQDPSERAAETGDASSTREDEGAFDDDFADDGEAEDVADGSAKSDLAEEEMAEAALQNAPLDEDAAFYGEPPADQPELIDQDLGEEVAEASGAEAQKRPRLLRPGVIFFALFLIAASSAIAYWYFFVQAPPANRTAAPTPPAASPAPEEAAPAASDKSANTLSDVAKAALGNGTPIDARGAALPAADDAILNERFDDIKVAAGPSEDAERAQFPTDGEDDPSGVDGAPESDAASAETEPVLSEDLGVAPVNAEGAAIPDDATAGNEIAFDEMNGAAAEGAANLADAEETLPPEDAAIDADTVETLETMLVAERARAEALEAQLAAARDTAESGVGEIEARLEEERSRTQSLRNELAATRDRFESASSELETLLEEERARADALRNELAAARAKLEAEARDREAAERARAEAEARAGDLESEVAALSAIAENAPIARSALALSALHRAVDEGRPFTSELRILQEIAPNAPSLRVLAAFADDGAPTTAEVRDRFAKAVRDGLAVARREEADGIISRYAARAASAVSMRPTEPVQGDAAGAVISRAEYAVEHDRIDRALAEIETLPPAAQAAMGDWIALARDRVAIDTALDALNDYLAGGANGL